MLQTFAIAGKIHSIFSFTRILTVELKHTAPEKTSFLFEIPKFYITRSQMRTIQKTAKEKNKSP